MVAGLSLQAIALGWIASEASVHLSYASLIGPFLLAGSGMALVFAPAANAVLSAVRTDQAGQASGATNAIRELGGVLGVAVLATVFTQPWRLHLAPGIRQRRRAGGLGRRGGARRRGSDRGCAAVQHPRGGARAAPEAQAAVASGQTVAQPAA